jgi:serine/threonine protein phosphatase 1
VNEKILIVGDIHGDWRRLSRMLEAIERLNRRTIFLGDYVNRGPESNQVIESLSRLSLYRGDQFVFLAGNHELALIRFLDGGSFGEFAAMGGIPTIKSYVADQIYGNVSDVLQKSLPAHHLDFMKNLEACWESDALLVSHAGYDPEHPLERSLEFMVARTHPSMFADKTPPRSLVVCGHYVQNSGLPYVSERLICIDTGCGTRKGRLTAVLLPERCFITV